MRFSVVIPCYNEGEKILKNIKLIEEKLESLGLDYNITIVNDGSTDNTYEALKTIKDKNVFIEGYEKNRGKGYAVKHGIQSLFDNNRAGDYINFMDADLSTNLSAIDTTLENLNYDVIIGSRRHKNTKLPKPQGLVRRITSKACIILTKLITGLKVGDTQCGFKTFKQDVIKEIIEKQKIERFAFDVEYLYIANLHGYSIKEIPIVWENDSDSKVSTTKSSIRFFKDLFYIRRNRRCYSS